MSLPSGFAWLPSVHCKAGQTPGTKAYGKTACARNEKACLDPMRNTPHEEAARYALLRRVAPTLRHHLAGEFQPLGMMAALMERRLQQSDLTGLREHCTSLGQLSRQAAERSMALMNWVAPRALADVAVEAGLAECVSLLATGLRFRGFALIHEAGPLSAKVPGHALRSVLPAAILQLSDSSPGPADLHLRAQPSGAQVSIEIRRVLADRVNENLMPADYRPLQWADVCVLAEAESIVLQQSGSSVQLLMPLKN